MAQCKIWILFFGCIVFHVNSANESFVPSDVWKTIEEGQTIPAGLHVRINLETGKKEARLMQDDSNPKFSLMKMESESSEEDINKHNSFRSYEEIKSELKDINLKVNSELEMIGNLMKEFVMGLNGSAEAEGKRDLVIVLSDLEYLIHQYDNAVEFARLDGFQTVIIPCLNGSLQINVQMEALKLVGSAVQSNPKVQRAALDSGCLTILLKLLALQRDQSVRGRGLFALSCLLRSFPPAQLTFVQDGGISVLSKLFDEEKDGSDKTRLKMMNLLTDLLEEMQHADASPSPHVRERYELIKLELNLREQGWCDRAASFFKRLEDWNGLQNGAELDHGLVDSCVNLLLALSESCLSDFVINLELVSAVNHAKEVYSELALHELDDGVQDSLFSQILAKLRSLAVRFARTNQFKDEL